MFFHRNTLFKQDSNTSVWKTALCFHVLLKQGTLSSWLAQNETDLVLYLDTRPRETQTIPDLLFLWPGTRRLPSKPGDVLVQALSAFLHVFAGNWTTRLCAVQIRWKPASRNLNSFCGRASRLEKGISSFQKQLQRFSQTVPIPRHDTWVYAIGLPIRPGVVDLG